MGSPKSRCIQAGRTFKKRASFQKERKVNARRLHPKIQFGLPKSETFFPPSTTPHVGVGNT